ncbi:hypothetical protein EDB83DRAFT_2523840 [Lactarius deliciosus]|nr:hypothetical protein EDB83DRAFT_2523840 [Lactarius deliciosus]
MSLYQASLARVIQRSSVTCFPLHPHSAYPLRRRGFADSTDTPSEAGVVLDTRAARDWLRVRGAAPVSVLVVRSNLGTGVAVQFASALEVEADAGDKQTKSGVAGWVHPGPCGTQYRMLTYGLLVSLQSLKAPLLFVYGEDDLDIPVWHAQMLFDAFLEKHLPALPEITSKMTAVMVRRGEVAESVAAAGAGAHARDGARRAREGFLEGPGGRRGRVLAYVVGRARHRAREGVQDFMAET